MDDRASWSGPMLNTQMKQESLEEKCKRFRRELFEMFLPHGGTPFPSASSCLEILVALYYQVKRPEDIVIISKGHGASVRYPIL